MREGEEKDWILNTQKIKLFRSQNETFYVNK